MELKVLDLRDNPLLSGKVPKTLKNTVIIGWDNAMHEKLLESVVAKSDLSGNLETATPFFIVKANDL